MRVSTEVPHKVFILSSQSSVATLKKFPIILSNSQRLNSSSGQEFDYHANMVLSIA